MKRSLIAFSLLAATAGIFSPPLYADQAATQPANVSNAKGAEGTSATVAKLEQAEQLASYARQNQAPVVMLAAVQMMEQIQLQDNPGRFGQKEPKPEAQAQNSPAGKKGDSPAPSSDPLKLLAEAKQWAKDDDKVSALIDAEIAKVKELSGGTLGASSGPILHRDEVDPYTSDYYTVMFDGGQPAAVGIDGDDDTELDLYIYDENGNLISSNEAGTTDHRICRWTPSWTGKFKIRIYNRGGVYNNYLLSSN